ncbi:MAG TPA: winged helix-turn-helix domain-containing protein [Candidatus Bathyarchaeia archaeon]|nr:winged helix-turn-helix domain-containing protein [Candidatus Bathyarchaeia archaeon]
MAKTYSQEQLSVIFNNEIRTMTVRLLQIYTELSLAQLSEIMSMNKTTIQYHLKLLRDKEIIFVSRESQEDSRGSIPTKYYQLKFSLDRYRASFNDIKKIKDKGQRLQAYTIYLQSLQAGLKDIKNQISFAEEAIVKSLSLIEDCSKQNLTDELLENLHSEIHELKSGITSFSTTKEGFSKITNEIPIFYEKFEKIHQENKQEKTEGFEIITLSIPLINLIESKLKSKQKD